MKRDVRLHTCEPDLLCTLAVTPSKMIMMMMIAMARMMMMMMMIDCDGDDDDDTLCEPVIVLYTA